jgi:hypothetical protein
MHWDDETAELGDDALRCRVDVTYVGSNAAQARWLQLIGEVDRRGLWALDGQTSLAAWLVWKFRMSRQTAKEKARVAKGMRQWTAVAAAYAAGEIPYSSLRQIIRIRQHDDALEQTLLALARTRSSDEVTVAVRRALELEDSERPPFERRGPWAAATTDGMVVGGFTLGPIEGRVFLAALEAFLSGRVARTTEGVAAATPSDDTRSLDQRRADALTEMASGYLAGATPDTTGSDRYTVNVVVDAQTVAEGRLRPDGCCETLDGTPLPHATLQRLWCDSGFVRVLTNEGRITDIGTRDRRITAAMRKKLHLRDRGCVFPGCAHRRWVDAHHIVPVLEHGPTDAQNLVLLCGHHHHLVHDAGWQVLGDPELGPLTFLRPDGSPVEARPPLRRAG